MQIDGTYLNLGDCFVQGIMDGEIMGMEHFRVEELIDSVRILAKIQSDCNGLNTLTTSRYSTNAMELTLDALDSPETVAQAITLVDARFRAISSLQEIIVEVYEDGPSDDIRTEMKSHGWTISATKKGKELGSDSSFDDIGVDYDRYDDYDIDNDSDFWRRAAD
ncbi:hypothetical protein EPUS_06892 [Endocarpon pusillum Z07020]|uniref:Uncharacterized protein n=1 Tax=Endocarpon pusillum (strain Z07020 / HMAS-L-300199) TaxID=1263415 RepID=U1I4I2_ENDPU|nr:uncharacterized protein EPUS_06892 [Endocarpon pusillum Z07020]ERF77024.1 hypothetical protein EPUS_06892 [Endocarpon pusillum Z07020]